MEKLKRMIIEINQFKKNARNALFKNYIHYVFVGIIMAMFVGNYMISSEASLPIIGIERNKVNNSVISKVGVNTLNLSIEEFKIENIGVKTVTKYLVQTVKEKEKSNDINTDENKTNTDNILNVLFGTTNIDEIDLNQKRHVNDGTIGLLFKAITIIQRNLFSFIVSISTFLNDDFIGGIMSLLIAVSALAIKIFLANPLKVGEARFAMESRTYEKTSFMRILYPFKKKRYLKTVNTMLVADLYQFLWLFTIVGGIIKMYSYRMVPYIVAENPNINSKEAITLSRELMNGNKLKAFMIDLSFVGWTILQVLTFGVIGYLYTNPYYRATDVELYNANKKLCKAERVNLLNDQLLENPEKLEIYPGTKERKKIKVKNDTYYKRYSITSYILFFFIFSFVGYLYEVILYLFREGMFINRGTLIGPWLPIYGFGCITMLLLMIPKKSKKITDNPILTFILITIICSIIEYATAWYMETFLHAKWWDYSLMFMNIKGRICIETSVLFGIGGSACIYIVAPWIEKKLSKIPELIKIVICVILVSIIMVDYMYTQQHPHKGYGISEEIVNIQEDEVEIKRDK